jgi:hypothetical protein
MRCHLGTRERDLTAFVQIFAMRDAALQKFALPERGRFAAAENTNA